MYENKFIQCLRRISWDRYKDFRAYIKQQKLAPIETKMFTYLDKYASELASADEGKLKKRFARQLLEKKLKMNRNVLKNAFSGLMNQFREFLIQDRMQGEGTQKRMMLLEAYRAENLYDLFEEEYRRLVREQEKVKVHDWKYHWMQFQLSDAWYNYANATKRIIQDRNPSKWIENWDVQYVLNKVRFMCGVQSFVKGTAIQVQQRIDPEHIERIIEGDKEYWNQFPLIRAYYMFHKLQKGETFDDRLLAYKQLRGILKEDWDYIPPYDLRQLSSGMFNFCTREARKGKLEFDQDSFEIMRNLLEAGCLFVDNRLQPIYFTLLVNWGLYTSHIEWVEGFIEAYKDHLPTEKRAIYYPYSKALVAFEKGLYKEVFRYLLMQEKLDVAQEISLRRLRIKCKYELELMKTEDERLDERGEDPMTVTLAAERKWLIRQLDIRKIRPTILSSLNFLHLLKLIHKQDISSYSSFQVFREEELKESEIQILSEQRWLKRKFLAKFAPNH